MRRMPLMLLALLLAGAGATRAEAQSLSLLPLALEVRVGAGVPTGDFAAREPGFTAQSGLAFGIGAQLRLIPLLGVYALYRQERFGCGECAEVGIDDGALSAGAEAGAQVNLPVGFAGLRPWVRGGVVRQALELAENAGGVASENGTGFAVGGGLRVGVGELVLLPGVHYRSYPAEFRFRDLPERSIDVTQLVVDVGVAVPF